MDTTQLQENISAMVDGELPDCDVELTMAALAGADGRARWHAYQLIGDVLRADAAGAGLSAGFRARLAERLAREAFPSEADDAAAAPPQAVAPASAQGQPPQPSQSPPQSSPASSATSAAASAPPPSASPSSPQSQPPGDSAAPAAVGTR